MARRVSDRATFLSLSLTTSRPSWRISSNLHPLFQNLLFWSNIYLSIYLSVNLCILYIYRERERNLFEFISPFAVICIICHEHQLEQQIHPISPATRCCAQPNPPRAMRPRPSRSLAGFFGVLVTVVLQPRLNKCATDALFENGWRSVVFTYEKWWIPPRIS